jgi:iron complex transport system permease protein
VTARRGRLALLASGLFLLACVTLAISLGTEPVSLVNALMDPTSLDRVILTEARIPRVLLACVAGGGLATVGVAFQAVLGNPLAEPYVLGVSGGAALGATLAIVLGATGLTVLGATVVPIAALLGGVAATAFVALLGRSTGAMTRTSMLLAGVVVNAMTSAAITLVKTLVSASHAQEVLFWLTGFLDASVTPMQLGFVALYVATGTLSLARDAGALNLLSLGDDSVTGLIGFVGLIVPHALRRLFGPDVRVLLGSSLLAGGGVLVLCDLGGRLLFRWLFHELPVGVVTALVGGPLFLVILRRRDSAFT